ncbi:MAG: substrate-binding domain-containing protein [Proteobacteria bacterium]|nr:substrate-binding domain-containing protein [Pseudomonadota bacterium]
MQTTKPRLTRRVWLTTAVAALAALGACTTAPQQPAAQAAPTAEVRVVSSGGFTAAYKVLAPLYQEATGRQVVSAYGASMGNAPDAIPSRLARGERFDVVILADSALEKLIKEGKVVPGSRVDLGRSVIAAAVRKGTPKPDISTVAALKNTLLHAKSIAYSASASGTYLSTEVFPKLDVNGQIAAKARRILSERVGAVVARGDAEIGFQQASELLPFTELEYLGPLPEEVQQRVFFSAGVLTDAPNPEGARQFIRYLASPAAASIVRGTGLEPAGEKR